MVPAVLEACDELERIMIEGDNKQSLDALIQTKLSRLRIDADNKQSVDSKTHTKFARLRIRCNWLAAGFYLWRSRVSRVVWESREAEDEGIAFIEETATCFDSKCLKSIQTLRTPHLVSPGRSESHWKEISPVTLTKFRDDIQASSVVSLARQKFQDLVAKIEKKQAEFESDLVSEEDAGALTEIGETLFERYKSAYGDSGAKHMELIEDFLAVHGDELLALSKGEPISSEDRDKSFIDLVPLGAVNVQNLLRMSNPSILTMLITCLHMNTKHRYQVAELLVRLVLTTKDTHGSLLQRISDAKAVKRSEGGHDEENFSDSDDDSVLSDGASVDRNAANKNVDEKRARQCGHLVKFLIDSLSGSFSTHMDGDEKARFLSSSDCIMMIQTALTLSSDWFQTTVRLMSAPDDSIDQDIFRAARFLVRHFCTSASTPRRLDIEQLFFNAMVKMIIPHRQILESLVRSQGDRAGRSARQKLCIKRAEFIGLVASELGYMLSQRLGQVRGLCMTKSELLICAANTENAAPSDTPLALSSAELTMFFDSILALWKYASQADTELAELGTAVSSFDRPIIRELLVAMGIVVVGLCGSATSTRGPSETSEKGKGDTEPEDPLCLMEFFDSDASANDSLSDNESEVKSDNQKKTELLRSICHAVHCINLVVGRIDDKKALSLFADKGYGHEFGPLLPLVTTRVLSYFADSILLNFENDESENKKQARLWSEEYPFSTRTTGELLDSILHKTYRWLYGFAIVGENNHNSTGKDLGSSMATISELSVKDSLPESTAAAAQLYRCIVRAYATGRRSPPKAALEFVSLALPPLRESAKSKDLRSFMFASDASYFEMKDVTCLVKKEENWDAPFRRIQSQVGNEEHEGKLMDTEFLSSVDEEIMQVRRGISSQLAQGPLPVATSDSGRNKSDAGADDERSSAIKNEEEMTKKFCAILDDLCLGDVKNGEGWYRAAQCLTMKAELISDRLGLSKGFSRSNDFSIPTPRPPPKRSLELSELEAELEREASLRRSNYVGCLGQDLSLYVRHTWSSFSSLRECSSKIGKQIYNDIKTSDRENSEELAQTVAWKEIEALHKYENYVGWQEAWGGIFVYALRKLSMRFLCVALYALQTKNVRQPEDKVLMSGICEALGIAFYTELMASQNYGYPMHVMAEKRKRDLAKSGNSCFQAAAVIAEEPGEQDDGSEARATWDLVFMIGKVRH
jgi:hypothetical protein